MTKTKSSLSQICILFPLLVIALGCKGDDEEPIPSTGDLLWAVQAGGPGGDRGVRVVTKSDGSIVVSGHFDDTITFEDTIPETHSVVGAGENDVFLTQYNSTGVIDWVTSAGGTSGDSVSGLAALSDNRIVVSGDQANATFGLGEENETTLTGSSDFLSWYGEDNHLSSAQTRAGSGFSLAVGEDDSVVVSGSMSNEAVFGEGDPNETTLTSVGKGDIFVAKYNDDGTLDWAKRAGGTGADRGYGVAVSSDESVVVVGSCDGEVVFGEGEANETTLDCISGSSGFIAKFKSSGDLVWVKGLGNSGYSVEITDSDEIFVSGSIHVVSVFGQGEENETTLSPIADQSDGFIAKFDSTGQLIWVEQLGGAVDADATAVGALSDGSAIVAGYFRGQFTVSDPPVEYSVPNTEDTDTFYLARFSPSGEVEWIKSAVSSGSAIPYDLSVGTDNTISATGTFYDDITFGVGESRETTLLSAGVNDVFVAKFES